MRIPFLNALRNQGFQVGAVGSEDSAPFDKENIAYYRYFLSRWLNPVGDYRSIIELRNLIAMHKPDIVHAFDTKPALLTPLAARKTELHATLRTITGMGFLFSVKTPLTLTLRPIYRHLQKLASSNSEITVFQNSDDLSYFLDNGLVPEHKAELIQGSGIDLVSFKSSRKSYSVIQNLRRELQIEPSEVVVTMIARLIRTKGVMEFCEAANRVRKEIPNVRFLLVGPTSSEGKLAVSADELKHYGGEVQLLGPRKDVREILEITDIFTLPSYYREGIPRVLLEAAAVGLPIVTTSMPGCKEVVVPDSNGILVTPRDVDSLHSAIRYLVLNSEVRKQMGIRSMSHVERFSLDRIVEQHATLYQRILAGI